MDYGIDNDDAIKDLRQRNAAKISECGDGEAKLTSTGMQGCVKRPSPVGKRARNSRQPGAETGCADPLLAGMMAAATQDESAAAAEAARLGKRRPGERLRFAR